MFSKQQLTYILHFILGGLIGLSTDLGSLFLLVTYTSLNHLVCVFIAFVLSVIVSFLYQRFVTHKHSLGDPKKEFFYFFGFWGIMSFVNVFLVHLFSAYIGIKFLLLAQIGSSAVIACISFLTYRYIIFSDTGKKSLLVLRDYILSHEQLCKNCGVLFLLAFVLRVGVLLFIFSSSGVDGIILGDTKRYLGNAESLLARGSFSYGGFLEAYRAPGYPFILSIFLASGLPLWLLSLKQIILGSLLPVLVYLLSIKLSVNKKVAFFIGVVFACELVGVYYSVVLLPDVFYSVLTLSVFFLVLEWLKKNSISVAVLAGILLGISNYLRPANTYLTYFIVFFYILFLFLKHIRPTKKIFLGLLCFLVIPVACMLPWQIRNYTQFGVFDFTSAKAVNGYNYNAASTKAVAEGKTYDMARQELMVFFRDHAPVPEDQKNFKNVSFLNQTTKEIVMSHKFIFIKNYLLGLNTFLFSGNYHYMLGKYDLLQRPSAGISFSLVFSAEGFSGLSKAVVDRISNPYYIWAIGGKIFWLLVVLLSLLGALIKRNQVALLFLLYILYFSVTILSVSIGVEARHRYMLNPLIFAFASVMLGLIYERLFNRRTNL